MFIPLIIGLIAFFILSWIWKRSRTLTRDCRWREDRQQAGPDESFFHCVTCGAETRLPKGDEPRHCLRGQQ
ncbi:hypothetical protein [Falsirhodobacter sp. alg1]|uniref:hypothetical protein n=1 Tax=Falsirhodobacter sp. alg1 TaxID=1472418 RepID=UPI0006943046|nr:hypothetical protein [Falsirhodobacter sp. alg1]